MHKHRAFTIIELLVVIAIIAVLIGLIFPAIGMIKNKAHETENNVQVRNVIQSLIAYSDNHRGFFPGFNGFDYVPDTLPLTGKSGNGLTVQARYWMLLDGNFTDGDALISPAENKEPWPNEQYPQGSDDRQKVFSDNYSYSFMRIGNGAATDSYRPEEWRNKQNSLAPIVTDRLAATSSITPNPGNPDTYLSIHKGSTKGEWRGSIGYGDLHVDFSDTTIIPTRFADQRNDADDIFDTADGDGGGLPSAVATKNAVMTYEDTNVLIGIIK